MTLGSLSFGTDVLQWLKSGDGLDDSKFHHRLAIYWRSFWFDVNLKLQRRLFPSTHKVRDPIFILGLWRTGSTFLHNVLGSCPTLTCPATWQCMNASSFRMQSQPEMGKKVRRPMDGFTIDNLAPQEDEFALMALGVPSVYRGFLDPRRLDEVAGWLDSNRWHRDDPSGWMHTWLEFLGAVTESEERLVIKSPPHSFRIRALLETFPASHYVWLVRDPADTFQSNRKMWTSMFQQHALSNWIPEMLDRFLLHSFECAKESLAFATSQLPRDRLAVVDFEELIKNPVQVVERINRRLHLGEWAAMQPTIADAVDNMKNYRGDEYARRNLPPEFSAVADALSLTQQFALETHGLK